MAGTENSALPETISGTSAEFSEGQPENGESFEQREYTYEEIPVDKSKIIITYDVEPLSEVDDDSSVTQMRQTYGTFSRTYQVFYPRFSDGIPYGGSKEIQIYYAALAEAEKNKMENYFAIRGFGDTVYDSPSEEVCFYYQVYGIEYYKNFLSVTYTGEGYSGGAHGDHTVWADNFDLSTGALLKYSDVFDLEEKDRLGEIIRDKLKPQSDLLYTGYEFDILGYPRDLTFIITAEGLTFVFQEYEIGPYSSGTITTTIPYEDLQPVLKISIE